MWISFGTFPGLDKTVVSKLHLSASERKSNFVFLLQWNISLRSQLRTSEACQYSAALSGVKRTVLFSTTFLFKGTNNPVILKMKVSVC